MSGFFQILMHIIFIASFLFIYILAVIILKPFRLHRKRPVSTFFLKSSYLLYLIFFLVFTYLALYFSENQAIRGNSVENQTPVIYYVMVLTAFFVPNIGIMIRRKFRKTRKQYNYIAGSVNILIILYIIHMITAIDVILGF